MPITCPETDMAVDPELVAEISPLLSALLLDDFKAACEMCPELMQLRAQV